MKRVRERFTLKECPKECWLKIREFNLIQSERAVTSKLDAL